jgi:hypothetical protein
VSARRTTKRLPIRKTLPSHLGPWCIKIPDFKGMSQRLRKPARRKKKPPRGKRTFAEKQTNRQLARIRVKVEHDLAGVKRSRIVKDVLRNTKEGVSDSVMEAGRTHFGLPNYCRPLDFVKEMSIRFSSEWPFRHGGESWLHPRSVFASTYAASRTHGSTVANGTCSSTLSRWPFVP